MNREERKRYGKEYVAINRRLEKVWFPKVQKAIKGKVSSLISKLRNDGIQAAIKYLNSEIGNYQLTQVIYDLYRSVGLFHARRTEKRLRAEVAKSGRSPSELKRIGYAEEWTKFIQSYLEMFLLEKITFKVNETTREALLKVLFDAIEEGWGIDEIVNRLQDMPFTAMQAARITRTEINRASNVGVYAQGTTFEYELMKVWISVRDNRTRGVNPEDHADHFHLDGQTVDFESSFRDPRNGHELQHPGDPEAEAEDVINCRCNFATIPKRNEDGRLVPKKTKKSAGIVPV